MVRKATVYILLSFYVFAQVKPLAFIVEDFLAHSFWRVQHMATVHFENGHYHIHQELSDISEKENKSAQEKTPATEKMNENTVQNIHKLNFNFQTNIILIPVSFHQTQNVLAGFTTIYSPPPKV